MAYVAPSYALVRKDELEQKTFDKLKGNVGRQGRNQCELSLGCSQPAPVGRWNLAEITSLSLITDVGTFVTFCGAAAGQPQGDFLSTADQALSAANGGSINSWVVPSGGNVTERMSQQADLRISAEELYLAVLTRLPTEEEIAEVTNYLTTRAADKSVAAQELVWGLLNSAAFRFNH